MPTDINTIPSTEVKDTQTQDSPNDMLSKSQREMNIANAIIELPKEITQEGREKKRDAESICQFAENTENISEEMNNASDGEEFEFLLKNFKETLPEKIVELSKKYKETEELGIEIKKIVEYMESLEAISYAIKNSQRIQKTLPKEILEAIEKVQDKAFLAWGFGDQEIQGAKDLEGSDSERIKKLNEIVDNAKKNIEPLQRTIGRTPSEEAYKTMKKVSGPSGLKQQEQHYDNIYLNKVEERITQNMQEKGRTKEEIQIEIDKMKQKIQEAIEKEKKPTVTLANSSSYTTPQS